MARHIVSLIHFCELNGPSVVFCTQSTKPSSSHQANSHPPLPPQTTTSCSACSPWYPPSSELPQLLDDCIKSFPDFSSSSTSKSNFKPSISDSFASFSSDTSTSFTAFPTSSSTNASSCSSDQQAHHSKKGTSNELKSKKIKSKEQTNLVDHVSKLSVSPASTGSQSNDLKTQVLKKAASQSAIASYPLPNNTSSESNSKVGSGKINQRSLSSQFSRSSTLSTAMIYGRESSDQTYDHSTKSKAPPQIVLHQANSDKPISPSPSPRQSSFKIHPNEHGESNIKTLKTIDRMLLDVHFQSSRFPLEVGMYPVLRTACVRSISCELTPTRSGGPILFSFTSSVSSTGYSGSSASNSSSYVSPSPSSSPHTSMNPSSSKSSTYLDPNKPISRAPNLTKVSPATTKMPNSNERPHTSQDTQFYVLAFLFQLNDSTSRGSVRSYAFVYLSEDRDTVVHGWDRLINHFSSIATSLQALAEKVNESEKQPTSSPSTHGTLSQNGSHNAFDSSKSDSNTKPLNQSRPNIPTLSPDQFLRRSGNPTPSIRSLVEIVGDKTVFVTLHLHFAVILRNILKSIPKVPLISNSSTFTKLFSDPTPETQTKLDEVSPYSMLYQIFIDMSTFSFCHLINHIILGDQIVIRGTEKIALKLFEIIKIILPEACINTFNNHFYSQTYHEPWECNILGVPASTVIPLDTLKSCGIGVCVINVDENDDGMSLAQYPSPKSHPTSIPLSNQPAHTVLSTSDKPASPSGRLIVMIDIHFYGNMPPIQSDTPESKRSSSGFLGMGTQNLVGETEEELCCGFTWELMMELDAAGLALAAVDDASLDTDPVIHGFLSRLKNKWSSKSCQLFSLSKSPSFTTASLPSAISTLLGSSILPYSNQTGSKGFTVFGNNSPSSRKLALPPLGNSGLYSNGSSSTSISLNGNSSAVPPQLRRQSSRLSLLGTSLKRLFVPTGSSFTTGEPDSNTSGSSGTGQFTATTTGAVSGNTNSNGFIRIPSRGNLLPLSATSVSGIPPSNVNMPHSVTDNVSSKATGSPSSSPRRSRNYISHHGSLEGLNAYFGISGAGSNRGSFDMDRDNVFFGLRHEYDRSFKLEWELDLVMLKFWMKAIRANLKR